MPTFRRNILSPSSGLKALQYARTQKNNMIVLTVMKNSKLTTVH
jgi:hypothetical protein